MCGLTIPVIPQYSLFLTHQLQINTRTLYHNILERNVSVRVTALSRLNRFKPDITEAALSPPLAGLVALTTDLLLHFQSNSCSCWVSCEEIR